MEHTVNSKAYYGYLFAQKRPTKLLDALLRGIANYISTSIGDKDDKNLSPAKMASFYKAVGGNYDSLFIEVPHSSISWIYASIGCQHTLQPTGNDFEIPSIPALTTKGFVQWLSIEILLGPEEHVPFIQYAVNNFDIKHPETGESFPRDIPTEAFPLKPDAEIEAWHNSCAEKLRQHAQPNYHARKRQEPKDYFGPGPSPSSKSESKPIPYQHIVGSAPRQRPFLAPEEVKSSKPGPPSPLLHGRNFSSHIASERRLSYHATLPRAQGLRAATRVGQPQRSEDWVEGPEQHAECAPPEYRSSEDDREGVSRRHSRDEREKGSRFSSNYLPRIDRDSGREGDRDRDGSIDRRRDRDKGRERDRDRNKVGETTLKIAAQHRHLGVIELLQKGTEIETNEKEAKVEIGKKATDIKTDDKGAEVKTNEKGIDVEKNEKGVKVEMSDKGTEIETNEKGAEVKMNEAKAEIEVSWKCRCNRKFKAKFVSGDSSIAADFAREMNWDTSRDGSKISHIFSSYWFQNFLWALTPGFLGRSSVGTSLTQHCTNDIESNQPSTTEHQGQNHGVPGQSSTQVETDGIADTRNIGGHTTGAKVYICLFDKRKYSRQLSHAEVKHDSNSNYRNEVSGEKNMDKVMFMALRQKLLEQQMSRPWRWINPIKISGFEFWEFDLYHTNHVRPIQKDKMPQEEHVPEAQLVSQIVGSNSMLDGTSSAIDLPREVMIAQLAMQTAQLASPAFDSRKFSNCPTDEWEYTPMIQSELIKYKKMLYSDYLLHLFWHPEHTLPGSPIWRGLPRKIREELKCTGEEPKTGWGFAIQKEWDWETFAVLTSPVVLAIIIVAVVLCAKYQWPITYGVALGLAPITTISYINSLLCHAAKTRGLSE